MNKQRIEEVIVSSIKTKQEVRDNCLDDILNTGRLCSRALLSGKKILLVGNGGSAADAQHIAAELVVRFRSGVERKALPALALSVDPSMMSAGGNDYGFEHTYARAVEAYGTTDDVLVAISTSGTSKNILNAVLAAKSKNMQVVGLLGNTGGTILPLCDASVVVPSNVTARIQESHIMIGHIWCEIIEETLFPELFQNLQ